MRKGSKLRRGYVFILTGEDGFTDNGGQALAELGRAHLSDVAEGVAIWRENVYAIMNEEGKV